MSIFWNLVVADRAGDWARPSNSLTKRLEFEERDEKAVKKINEIRPFPFCPSSLNSDSII